MLYRHKQGTFEVCPFKATYLVKRDIFVENGTDKENNVIFKSVKIDVEESRYIQDKECFENILYAHEDYSNLKYEDVILTEEQKIRHKEIRELPENSIGSCIEYVKSGKFPKGNNHALLHIQTELEKQKLGQELSEREINEIILGIQMSDLEIRLLIGGL